MLDALRRKYSTASGAMSLHCSSVWPCSSTAPTAAPLRDAAADADASCGLPLPLVLP